MKLNYSVTRTVTFLFSVFIISQVFSCSTGKKIGVGAEPPSNAEILFNGSREMLDEKWTYWEGPMDVLGRSAVCFGNAHKMGNC